MKLSQCLTALSLFPAVANAGFRGKTSTKKNVDGSNKLRGLMEEDDAQKQATDFCNPVPLFTGIDGLPRYEREVVLVAYVEGHDVTPVENILLLDALVSAYNSVSDCSSSLGSFRELEECNVIVDAATIEDNAILIRCSRYITNSFDGDSFLNDGYFFTNETCGCTCDGVTPTMEIPENTTDVDDTTTTTIITTVDIADDVVEDVAEDVAEVFVCDICGGDGDVTNFDAMVYFPLGQPSLSCQSLLDAAAEGKVLEGQECNILAGYAKATCGCSGLPADAAGDNTGTRRALQANATESAEPFVCDICGGLGNVSNVKAFVSFPLGQESLTCAYLLEAAAKGKIDEGQNCDAVVIYAQQACGCGGEVVEEEEVVVEGVEVVEDPCKCQCGPANERGCECFAPTVDSFLSSWTEIYRQRFEAWTASFEFDRRFTNVTVVDVVELFVTDQCSYGNTTKFNRTTLCPGLESDLYVGK
jgi:hypothetical protein